MNPCRPRRGFSLMEVVIALAVAGFALSAIIGLMSVALASSRSSGEETVLAAMSSAIVGDLRSGAFTHAQERISEAPVVYFTVEGSPVAPLGTPITDPQAALEGALYRCALTLVPEPSTQPATDPGACILYRLVLDFSWPVGATAPQGSRTLHASLVRRQADQ